MEYTQWVGGKQKLKSLSCLNPCCNGIYSMSDGTLFPASGNIARVLILVVMEYTQWEQLEIQL